jgi:hypothetical protein
MANANIALITLANTFNDWRIQENNLANAVNNLRNSNYVKDNGSFIVANGAIQVTQTSGTGLSVTNNVLFSQLTTVNSLIGTGVATFDENVYISNASSTTDIAGNLVVGGNFTIAGNTTYASQNLLLRVGLPGTDNGALVVEQGLGGVGNAVIQYTNGSNVWQVSSNDISSSNLSTLLTVKNISDSVTNTSITYPASANAANWAYSQAILSQNTVAIYANGTIVLGNANINFNNTATVNVLATANGTHQANVSFSANTSAISVIVSGQAANAYAQANAAYTAANAAPPNIYANSGLVLANSPIITFNNSATVNAVVAANGSTGTNVAFTANVSGIGGAYLPLAGGTMTGTLYLLGAYTIGGDARGWYLSSAPSNQKYWDAFQTNNTLYYRTLNDAYNASNVYLQIQRSGTLITDIYYGDEGGAQNYTTHVFYGPVTISGIADIGTVVEAAYNEANTVQTWINTYGTPAYYANANAATATTQAVSAYAQANSATTIAENAYGQANSATTIAENAYGQANSATTIAENAYAAANSAGAGLGLHSANGYTTTADGTYIQYGQAIFTSAGVSITFPVAFPTACRSVVFTISAYTAGEGAPGFGVASITKTGFIGYVEGGSIQCAWQAIGY